MENSITDIKLDNKYLTNCTFVADISATSGSPSKRGSERDWDTSRSQSRDWAAVKYLYLNQATANLNSHNLLHLSPEITQRSKETKAPNQQEGPKKEQSERDLRFHLLASTLIKKTEVPEQVR